MSNFVRDLTENIAGFLKFMFMLAAIVVVVLFIRGGALQRLGIHAGVPHISGPSAGTTPQQEALANALRGTGVETIYGTPNGSIIRVTLSWPQALGPGKGGQVMAQAQSRKFFRTFAADGINNIDVRNQDGRPTYIARYQVTF